MTTPSRDNRGLRQPSILLPLAGTLPARDPLRSERDLRTMRYYAAALGYDLFDDILDVGPGADTESSIRSAVEMIENGTVDGIVVAHISRLGRDSAAVCSLVVQVLEAGGQVHSCSDGGNLSPDTASTIESVTRSALARFEELTAQRAAAQSDCSVCGADTGNGRATAPASHFAEGSAGDAAGVGASVGAEGDALEVAAAEALVGEPATGQSCCAECGRAQLGTAPPTVHLRRTQSVWRLAEGL